MTTNSREKGLLLHEAKLEGENELNKAENRLFKASTTSLSSSLPSTSSRQWGGFRNPRIVRVSRTLGGKDRHSKVCTVRGLRDRRIRLSVPTAVQLYDLQDRLNLSQPSKVIDWLLDATKDDIDKLPPLQIPQGFGHHFHHHQHILLPHDQPNPLQQQQQPPHLQPSFASFFDGNPVNFMRDYAAAAAEHQTLSSGTRTKYSWDMEAAALALKAKGKEIVFERDQNHHKSDISTIKGNEAENQDEIGIGIGIGAGFGGGQQQLFGQKFFPFSSQSSLPGLMLNNNNSMAYNYCYHSEPSCLSLSHFGSHGLIPSSQIDGHTGGNASPLAPLPLISGPSHELLFCPPNPPAPLPPSFFIPSSTPPYVTASSSAAESVVPRQINHVQLLTTGTTSSPYHLLPNNSLMPSLHSSSLPFKSFQTISNNPKQLHSHNNDENKPPEKGS